MIVYQMNKETFFQNVRNDTIADQVRACVREKLGRNTANNEFGSWRNSLRYMRDAIDDHEITNDCGVSIEFQIPSTSKRIDFIIGRDLKRVDGGLISDPLSHPGQDKTLSGLRKRLKQGAAKKEAVLAEADILIRSTCETVMTQGKKRTVTTRQ